MPASLEYPAAPSLAKECRRLHPREPLQALAYVEMEDNGAILLNISEWGLGLHAAQAIAAERQVRLRFKLPQSPIWIRASGRIVWRSESGKAAGVCFADLSEEVREQIRGWISAQAHVTPREACRLDSPSTAQKPATTPVSSSETTGLRVAAHKAAIQASERSGWAQLIARTKKRLRSESTCARSL